jgi:hypothetical protein
LAKDLNWQDLEASILAGSTEDGGTLTLSGHGRTYSIDPVCSPRSSYLNQSQAHLSPPSTIRASLLSPHGDAPSHSRYSSGLLEEVCDDFETALKSAATRLARSRWEELFRLHQEQREQQERERRDSWRLNEQQSIFKSRLGLIEAVQVFEKTPEVSPTPSRCPSPHAMPHRSSVSETKARLIEQGLLSIGGPAPSPASGGAATPSGARVRSGSFQGDRSNGSNSPRFIPYSSLVQHDADASVFLGRQ